MENNYNIIDQKNSVKITKNSKGYGWEFRISQKEGETNDQLIAEVEDFNTKLKARFGEQIKLKVTKEEKEDDK